MSPRPYWRGFLKLSLVSCPIAVHGACSSSERISFRQINRKTGSRLQQQRIDEETARGRYLPIEDEALEAIEIESTHTISKAARAGTGDGLSRAIPLISRQCDGVTAG